MKNVTMSKNAAIKDKELLKFIEKAQAIIQTSLQQELLSDLSTVSKFKTSKLIVGSKKLNSVGATVRNFVNKGYTASETKKIKRKLSKTNTLSQINRLDIPRSFTLSSPIHSIARRSLVAPISRVNSRSSVLKSKYDLYNTKNVLNQIDLKSEFKGIKLKSLFTDKNASRILKESVFMNFNQANGSTSSAVNKALKFKLHEVKCIDKTDDWGGDEIAAGAITTNDKGEVENVNEFLVANGFRDNIRKTYNPPRLIKRFPLNQDNIYPKTFIVFLNLAEKDHGGFSDFLSDLHEAIDVEMKIILTLLGAAVGTAAGPPYGTAVGALIGIATAVVYDALMEWFIEVLKDDLLVTEDFARVTLDTRASTFNNALNSPIVSMDYYGPQDGSHYRAKYSWEIEQ